MTGQREEITDAITEAFTKWTGLLKGKHDNFIQSNSGLVMLCAIAHDRYDIYSDGEIHRYRYQRNIDRGPVSMEEAVSVCISDLQQRHGVNPGDLPTMEQVQSYIDGLDRAVSRKAGKIDDDIRYGRLPEHMRPRLS